MCLWLYSLTLLAEVLDGVKIYFDFMLADHLLYSQEKAQYKNVVEENRAPMSSEGRPTDWVHAISEHVSAMRNRKHVDPWSIRMAIGYMQSTTMSM